MASLKRYEICLNIGQVSLKVLDLTSHLDQEEKVSQVKGGKWK